MPKELRGIFIFLLMGIFLFSSSKIVFASNDLTLSDLVLADLSIRNYLNNISVSLIEGKNNQIDLNQDRHWLPASTVKTFAALYVYDLISRGKLNLSNQYQIDSVNVVPTELETPEFPGLIAGEYVSLDRLIRQMITQSDNTAFNQMLDILGRENITDYIHSIGLTHSAVGSKLNQDDAQQQTEFDIPGYGINTTTSDDYAKAFVLIKNKKIPGASDLYSIFKAQKINNMIPLFLPKNVTVAHKHGDLDPLFHDGGIVSDSKRSYVLSIFTNLGDPSIVAHISQLIYTKDISLVGSKIPKNISEISNNYVDPMILSGGESNVLAAADQNVQSFPITASDLGIKSSDLLTPSLNQQTTFRIPDNSYFSFAQPILQTVEDTLNPVGSLNSSLSEANRLISQNKTKEAAEILRNVEPRLTDFVKSEDMSDPQTQSEIQEISNTRFTLLGNILAKTKNLEAKKALIKVIANGASSEVIQIEPAIPKAVTSSNLSQKPLLGEIINIMPNAVIVRSAGGQIVEIPSDTQIKTRAINSNKVVGNKITNIQVGTSVALLGTSQGNKFIPSFVLTNLDRQVIAPQPVSVLKVDSKNKIIVVSENGNPVQVNVSPQTIIKGSGTNVSFDSIKSGDTVIIRGQKLPTLPTNQNQQQKNQTPPNPSPNQQSPNLKSNGGKPSVNQSSGTQAQPRTNQTQTPQQPQPKIIQGTSIQVIERKKETKIETPKSNPPKPTLKKETHKKR